MNTYSRTQALELAGTSRSLHSAYLRHGHLPFDDEFSRLKAVPAKFRAHHVLMLAALKELAAANLIDNGFAGRIVGRAYRTLPDRPDPGAAWLAALMDADGERYLSGRPGDVAAAVGSGSDRVVMWNIEGTFGRVSRRAADAGLAYPATLADVVEEGRRLDAWFRVARGLGEV